MNPQKTPSPSMLGKLAVLVLAGAAVLFFTGCKEKYEYRHSHSRDVSYRHSRPYPKKVVIVKESAPRPKKIVVVRQPAPRPKTVVVVRKSAPPARLTPAVRNHRKSAPRAKKRTSLPPASRNRGPAGAKCSTPRKGKRDRRR